MVISTDLGLGNSTKYPVLGIILSLGNKINLSGGLGEGPKCEERNQSETQKGTNLMKEKVESFYSARQCYATE